MIKHKSFSAGALFLLCVALVSSKSAPIFSSTYSVSGTLYIPYAELKEPFLAWFDSEDERSRIDYYGGMVKTYQLPKDGKFGTSLKIAPMTTDTVVNVETCFKVDGADSAPITPQSILPNMTNFKLIGTEVMNGYQCEKWRDIESYDDRVSKYTMWIRWKKSPKTPLFGEPIPVRYEMKGYNSLLGSHYDHYYLDYDSYTFDKPSEDVFVLNDNVTCGGFPGPGEMHIYTFNPMKEFVERHTNHVDQAWESYKKTHSIAYEDKEHTERKEIFRQNLRYIHSTNRKGLGYTLGVNHLADRSDLELKALRGKLYSKGYNGADAFPYTSEIVTKMTSSLPDNFDWRILGAVTPVKDQSVCGSCWSFGTTGAMEGAYFVKTGQLLSFSQQALIDCSWGYGNNGCDGGEDFRSYQWIKKHGGIPTEDDYGPYYGQDGYCHTDKVTLRAPITGYVNVTPGDENALRVALYSHGPISVAIDASHKSFSFYNNGVYYDPECSNQPDGLDHAVLAVGYGSLNGKKYWLVKNSWSNYWGNQGYVLMSSKDNNCGVMTSPTYVTM